MKLKKSLLALTTAATVAVAGTATAVAEDTNPADSGSAVANTDKGDNATENGGEKDEDKDQSELAGSADKFFGWDENTSGLKKLSTVVTLITTIGALVAGLVTLANNFQKIPNLFK